MISVYILSAILGLCVGSFLNVVIYRLPAGMSLITPPSHCPCCGSKIKWYDNIPLVSYILLRGRCRRCHCRISIRYALSELANGALWLFCALAFWEASIVYAVCAALFSSLMICIFFIDLEHMVIYDRFVIMTAAAGAVASFFDPFDSVWTHLWGMALGGACFLLIFAIAYLIYKKEALGGGDVKLAFALGLFLGWKNMLLVMLLSSISASIILSLLTHLKKRDRGTEYPFAPFLTVCALFALFFGNTITNAYYSFLLAI